MILIDTSVWIPFFNDNNSVAANFVEETLMGHQAACINIIVEMEILQGIRDEKFFHITKSFLKDFQYFPTLTKECVDLSVEIFRACRKKGVTIRRSLDCLISANALTDGLTVAHQDRDFEYIKKVFPRLKTIKIG